MEFPHLSFFVMALRRSSKKMNTTSIITMDSTSYKPADIYEFLRSYYKYGADMRIYDERHKNLILFRCGDDTGRIASLRINMVELPDYTIRLVNKVLNEHFSYHSDAGQEGL